MTALLSANRVNKFPPLLDINWNCVWVSFPPKNEYRVVSDKKCGDAAAECRPTERLVKTGLSEHYCVSSYILFIGSGTV